MITILNLTDSHHGSTGLSNELLGEQITPNAKHVYVMPLIAVLVTASVGLLALMSYGDVGATVAFTWLVNVSSVACLQQWIAMLFTYIR